jgi:hypothetical protein
MAETELDICVTVSEGLTGTFTKTYFWRTK